jgi:calcineurin-like phosphoesterase family protein
MRTLIINDPHLGVKRQAGTTRKSREELDRWLLGQFGKLLLQPHDRLIILGDLFDKRNVEEHIMAHVIGQLKDEKDCIIVAGNHDLGGIDDRTISSAEFVAMMSGSYWLEQPEDIDDEKIFIIPHMHSQDEFDRAVSQCPDNAIMMVHCNIDSPFAHSDHSLNLSIYQMKDLEKRGVDIISGHEHTKRDIHNVSILGNQFPSSIADCIGGDKYAHVLVDHNDLVEIKTWDAKKGFLRTDTLSSIEDSQFIEIRKEVDTVSEYSDIVKEVAQFRRISDAFIVKNSVKVREILAVKSDEEVTHFNVIDMLIEELPGEFKKEVKSCL